MNNLPLNYILDLHYCLELGGAIAQVGLTELNPLHVHYGSSC